VRADEWDREHDANTACGANHALSAPCKVCDEILANLAALKADPTSGRAEGQGKARHYGKGVPRRRGRGGRDE
jgi:hypothetical protein